MIFNNKHTLRLQALFTGLLTLLITPAANAQDMADRLRTDGKIYVVVLVLATIFAGIIGFLIYLDRKVTRIERNRDQ